MGLHPTGEEEDVAKRPVGAVRPRIRVEPPLQVSEQTSSIRDRIVAFR